MHMKMLSFLFLHTKKAQKAQKGTKCRKSTKRQTSDFHLDVQKKHKNAAFLFLFAYLLFYAFYAFFVPFSTFSCV